MLEDFYKSYCESLYETLQKINSSQMKILIQKIDDAYQNYKQVFVLGNGGSAACASHWVCDFGKGINTEKGKRMKIFSLSDNASILTALGNDISYDDVFCYQLKNLAVQKDLVIFLSVSGNSKNLLKAADYCNGIGCDTVSIIGNYHGELGKRTKLNITLQSQNYGIVEDIHLIINHILSQYMKQRNLQLDEILNRKDGKEANVCC
ncbi:MAG TPA: hypothetical protein DEG06_11345 [Lachnospiraceae bacterium]|jgi:D-sedoheptulose 7-phosphate isomerase|nr:SIS domain-containing protein [Lachnospiraceae bacterium]HBI72026.1 hypothetical protein [Lachnospiraceae bacterium]HBY72825.1 hypothetical protein [Lachnospiraceae bacterium]HCA69396.1 hypothetical protein [Lachnospiraceae bacterium]HCM13895.1 hypothetical protein [Lachnospiraceae bacterium]